MTGRSGLPVADEWFRVTHVCEGVTLIEEPHSHPLLRANTWHVRGRDRDLLIDTGLGVAPLRGALPGLVDGRPLIAVLTHDHLDHMGGAHELAEVWAHPAEQPHLPDRGSLHGRTLARILGLPEEEMPPWLLDALPEPAFDPAHYLLRPVIPTRAVTDGDRIDLGDRVLEVLHLPGHSPGSIALLDRDTATLYSGDVVYDDDLLDDVAGSDRAAYARSMRLLLDLDVDVVHPGHAGDLDGDRLHTLAEAYLAAATTHGRT